MTEPDAIVQAWNKIEDGAAALVNGARLDRGMRDTSAEWAFLLAAARELALAAHLDVCHWCDKRRAYPAVKRECPERARLEGLGREP